jgi:hypothetical protein
LVAQINSAVFSNDPMPAGRPNPMTAKLQVMLDRAHAAPGVIDGFQGAMSERRSPPFRRCGACRWRGTQRQRLERAGALDARPPLAKSPSRMRLVHPCRTCPKIMPRWQNWIASPIATRLSC